MKLEYVPSKRLLVDCVVVVFLIGVFAIHGPVHRGDRTLAPDTFHTRLSAIFTNAVAFFIAAIASTDAILSFAGGGLLSRRKRTARVCLTNQDWTELTQLELASERGLDVVLKMERGPVCGSRFVIGLFQVTSSPNQEPDAEERFELDPDAQPSHESALWGNRRGGVYSLRIRSETVPHAAIHLSAIVRATRRIP